jgi:pyroglutamyl-peptidase
MQSPEQFRPLVEGGPEAFRSGLPLGGWAVRLRESGIPAEISYHAGTYLCNATLYFSSYIAERLALKTKAAFVHLPLDLSQTASQVQGMASLPAATSAAGLRLILEDLARGV